MDGDARLANDIADALALLRAVAEHDHEAQRCLLEMADSEAVAVALARMMLSVFREGGTDPLTRIWRSQDRLRRLLAADLAPPMTA